MDEKIFWIAGFIVGFLTVAVVGAIVSFIYKKKNNDKAPAKYDERQVLARGKAFSRAFFTSLIYMAACAIADVMEIKWAELNVQMFLGIFVAIMVFALTCIFNDAYFTADNQKNYSIVLFGVVIACNLFVVIDNLINGESVLSNGILNRSSINVIVVVVFTVILISLIIKKIMDKKASVYE